MGHEIALIEVFFGDVQSGQDILNMPLLIIPVPNTPSGLAFFKKVASHQEGLNTILSWHTNARFVFRVPPIS